MPTSCCWCECFKRAELSKIFHRVEELKANRARKREVIDSKSEAKITIVTTCFALFDFLGAGLYHALTDSETNAPQK